MSTANGFVPRRFRPAPWLPGPHLQTLGARMLRRRGGVPFARERLEMPDGDFVDLDFAWPDRHDGRRPRVVVLHGLEGSARSGYALEMYRALDAHGLAGVGLNFRSCSGELNRAARLYHSGETGDPAFVFRTLRDRDPGTPLGAVGFSLGGNVLLKHLGEMAGGEEILRAAAAISVPFTLSAGADHLERPGGWIYVSFLLRKLRRKILAKRDVLGNRADVERALRARTFREFDDAATAPVHGFASAEDYYVRSSSAGFLSSIAVPTLLIHSTDDPFLPAAAVPFEAVEQNTSLIAAIEPKGGHVGFVSGLPWRPHFWAEWEAARFLATALPVG